MVAGKATPCYRYCLFPNPSLESKGKFIRPVSEDVYRIISSSTRYINHDHLVHPKVSLSFVPSLSPDQLGRKWRSVTGRACKIQARQDRQATSSLSSERKRIIWRKRRSTGERKRDAFRHYRYTTVTQHRVPGPPFAHGRKKRGPQASG